MRTAQLHYFVAAAESLSFTEAARVCCVAQPAISQQIKKLEEELGFELFRRTPHGLELTEAGSLYYAEAAKALRGLELAGSRARCVAEGSAGVLTVGACGSTQGADLVDIRDFHYRMPSVGLVFRGINTRHMVAQLTGGEFDICYTDVAQLEGVPQVRFVCAETRNLCVMAHRDSPFSRRGPVTFEEVMAQTVILAEPSEAAQGEGAQRGLGSCVTGTCLRADTQENVQLMLRLNMGIAVAPDSVASAASDDIVIVPTAGPWPTITLAWAYLEGNNNPALALFLEFLAKR